MSAGSSNLVPGSDVGNVTSYVANGVGNGTYYVRVRAKNACGSTSAVSNEVTTVVGTATGEVFTGAIPSTSMGSHTSAGCVFAISVSGSFSVQINTNASGTITGTAAGTQNVGIVVTFNPANTTCTANPFTRAYTGTVTGTNSSVTAVAGDTKGNPKFTFNGTRSGNTMTGSLTIFTTTSDGFSDFTFTKAISPYTLTKQ